jgi:hypothetical protein
MASKTTGTRSTQSSSASRKPSVAQSRRHRNTTFRSRRFFAPHPAPPSIPSATDAKFVSARSERASTLRPGRASTLRACLRRLSGVRWSLLRWRDGGFGMLRRQRLAASTMASSISLSERGLLRDFRSRSAARRCSSGSSALSRRYSVRMAYPSPKKPNNANTSHWKA